MATHDEFDDFFGEDDTPVVDTRADGRLLRVPLARLSPNLVNPRTDFGTEDELLDFGKSLARRQNQACPVVSRSAYLKLWPDHADRVGDVDYVLVSGERRFRGATVVGLPALNCVVDDNVAADRRTFMEAVVSENVDRQNFDAIEEAYAVQALVAEFGSNRAVAQHFERVDGWVTQRILLTHLAPDVQDLVRKKTIPLEAARSLGKLTRDNGWSAAEQLSWWEDEHARRGAAAAARVMAKKAAKQQAVSPPSAPSGSLAAVQPESFTAVKPEPTQLPRLTAQEPEREMPESPALSTAAHRAAEGSESIPEPRIATPETAPLAPPPLKRFPYNDGIEAAQHLIQKMPEDEFGKMLDLLNRHRQRQTAQTG